VNLGLLFLELLLLVRHIPPEFFSLSVNSSGDYLLLAFHVEILLEPLRLLRELCRKLRPLLLIFALCQGQLFLELLFDDLENVFK
jgi:hypothetical protein